MDTPLSRYNHHNRHQPWLPLALLDVHHSFTPNLFFFALTRQTNFLFEFPFLKIIAVEKNCPVCLQTSRYLQYSSSVVELLEEFVSNCYHFTVTIQTDLYFIICNGHVILLRKFLTMVLATKSHIIKDDEAINGYQCPWWHHLRVYSKPFLPVYFNKDMPCEMAIYAFTYTKILSQFCGIM